MIKSIFFCFLLYFLFLSNSFAEVPTFRTKFLELKGEKWLIETKEIAKNQYATCLQIPGTIDDMFKENPKEFQGISSSHKNWGKLEEEFKKFAAGICGPFEFENSLNIMIEIASEFVSEKEIDDAIASHNYATVNKKLTLASKWYEKKIMSDFDLRFQKEIVKFSESFPALIKQIK